MWVERLAWTLIHFLWQGALIAGVYGVARWAARQSSANARYVLASSVMAAIALAPLATWFALGPQTSDQIAASFAAPQSAGWMPSVREVPTQLHATASRSGSATALPWVVGLWFLGAAAFSLRLFLGWIAARSLSGRTAPPEWQDCLRDLQRRIGVSRKVRLWIAPLAEVPSVVGWLRPVVLTPVGALAGLPADQMEALLFHELAHIRRHDCLVNLLQSIVEALLFYHPAVWWISDHMRSERELCCDDLVVSITGDPVAYARALAGAAAMTRSAFTPAVAATGGSLAHRVARLLGHSRPARRTAPGAGGAAGAIAVVVTAVAVFAQPSEKPKFETASVKPSNVQPQLVRPQPGGLTANATVRMLMMNAYNLQAFQILGLPDWTGAERFDIQAKAEGNPNRELIFLMLQSLLADRFRLQVHREMREMPVYALVAARGGMKLPAPKDGSCVAPTTDAPPPPPGPGGRMEPPGGGSAPLAACGKIAIMLNPTGAKMQGGKVTMAELVRILSAVTDRIVVDQTASADVFDLKLEFLPDQTTAGLPPPPPDTPAAVEARVPSIITALQEQLGLRLQSTKGPVDTLVVDHVERPSAN